MNDSLATIPPACVCGYYCERHHKKKMAIRSTQPARGLGKPAKKLCSLRLRALTACGKRRERQDF